MITIAVFSQPIEPFESLPISIHTEPDLNSLAAYC
jgi:hypothetical protein